MDTDLMQRAMGGLPGKQLHGRARYSIAHPTIFSERAFHVYSGSGYLPRLKATVQCMPIWVPGSWVPGPQVPGPRILGPRVH